MKLHPQVSLMFLISLLSTFQMVSIVLLLSQPADWNQPLVWLGVVLMYLAVILTLVSMFSYLNAAMQVLD